jgi:hypothetical protein
MQVRDDQDGIVFVLQLDAIAEASDQVPQVKPPGGTISRQNTFCTCFLES